MKNFKVILDINEEFNTTMVHIFKQDITERCRSINECEVKTHVENRLKDLYPDESINPIFYVEYNAEYYELNWNTTTKNVKKLYDKIENLEKKLLELYLRLDK